MLVTLAGQKQVLIVSARSVMGILPENGRLLLASAMAVAK